MIYLLRQLTSDRVARLLLMKISSNAVTSRQTLASLDYASTLKELQT